VLAAAADRFSGGGLCLGDRALISSALSLGETPDPYQVALEEAKLPEICY